VYSDIVSLGNTSARVEFGVITAAANFFRKPSAPDEPYEGILGLGGAGLAVARIVPWFDALVAAQTVPDVFALQLCQGAGAQPRAAGDSRLFLFNRSGTLAVPVPGLKEGPTHDFCWSPKSDGFVTISGKSPPLAQLHAAKTGAPTFSFGTAAFNTARFAPHGRFLLLGGFGNMPGDISLWDVNKKKPLAPTFNAPCTVGVEWSPDSRYLLTSTTRPRLNVDNGYRLYSHRGVLVGAGANRSASLRARTLPAAPCTAGTHSPPPCAWRA
jgi:hypothetical protein